MKVDSSRLIALLLYTLPNSQARVKQTSNHFMLVLPLISQRLAFAVGGTLSGANEAFWNIRWFRSLGADTCTERSKPKVC